MDLFHINFVVFFQLPLLSFCLVFEFFSINCNALGQCLQAESSALLQLKRGFTSGDLDSWKQSTNCCIWEGVTCDESLGRVIGLDLSNQFIAGNQSRHKGIQCFGFLVLGNVQCSRQRFSACLI
ncbi:receptor-like protein 7 isoform X6 [Dendrobium catenatum]|uniref:receptor-like protein 7 isoform X6 n=1 Tax=Dendrobium catenatum TaxID=906689 RepID=UPI00109FA786|nr:receptor-like protein 7 isoform X6 [Dendrobium catenatum]